MKISEVHAESGNVTCHADGDRVVICGEIDQMSPRDFLAAFFEMIHNMALSEALLEIHIDLTKLLFLNSSGIKEFLSWILRRNRIAPEHKYRIHIISDPSIAWQPVTLSRLRDLDPEDITLTHSHAGPAKLATAV